MAVRNGELFFKKIRQVSVFVTRYGSQWTTTVFARDLLCACAKVGSPPLSLPNKSHSVTLYLFCISKITGILIRSKLTVTNKGTYQDTLACMQLYHAFLARLISRPPSPPTKSVGYDSIDRSQLYGRYQTIRFATQLRVFEAKFGPSLLHPILLTGLS